MYLDLPVSRTPGCTCKNPGGVIQESPGVMDYFITPRTRSQPLGWIIYSHLVAISLFSLFLHADGEVKVIWAQQSRAWTKLRGILGAPSDWAYDNSIKRRYISTSAEHGRNWFALGYDHHRDLLYWSDRIHGGIYVQTYTSAMFERPSAFRAVLETTSSNVRGVAVDAASGNVYFTDLDKKWIAMTSGRKDQKNVFKTLFVKDLDSPGDIAIDSDRGLLYWADLDFSNPRIEVSTLVGTQRKILVRDVRPESLTLDSKDNRLYWPDSTDGALYYLDLNKSKMEAPKKVRDLEVAPPGETLYPGVAVYDGIVMLSDTKELKIVAYDKNTGTYLAEQITDATPYDLEVPPYQQVPDVVCAPGATCEEVCLNLGSNKGRCSCWQGHYLELDSTSCTTTKPQYIYSMGRDVWMASVQIDGRYAEKLTMNETRYRGNLQKVQSLGFHHGQDFLYMGDTVEDIIFRGQPNTLNDLTALTVNTRQVEGISVDWVSGTLYWADAELAHVMCSQLDGRYHRIVLELDPTRGRPSGLAVDPINGRMYWAQYVENVPNSGSIQSAKLDGSDIVTVVNGSLSRPQAVVVDSREKKLYWTDRDLFYVEVSDLLGRDRKKIHDLSSVYGLTVFQDYTTWTANDRGIRFGIATEEKQLRNPEPADPDHPLQDHRSDAYDVVLYGNYLQPKPLRGRDQCKNNNGCDHHCVTMPTSYVCTCAIGFRLADDEKTCEQDMIFDKFLLYPDPYHKQIYQQSTSGGSVQGILAPLQDFPISSDYDPYTGRLFWIDKSKKEIASCFLDGTDKRVLQRISEAMLPVRLAINPINEMLCYTDQFERSVTCMKYDGSEQKKVLENLDDPHGIAIDPEENMLYWTETGNSGPGRVGRAQLDGREQVYLSALGSTLPEDPRAITVWPRTGMVYWADELGGQIMAFNTSSQELDQLGQFSGYAIHSLAADDTHVYFTAWQDKMVYRIELDSPAAPEPFHKAVFARITDLKVFDHGLPDPVFEVTGGGGGVVIPWMWIGVGLAAFFLLLFILLALLLGLRKKKPAKTPPSEHELGTGFDNGDVEREYMGFTNGELFDIRHSMAGNINGGFNQETAGSSHPNGHAGDYQNIGHDQPNGHAEAVRSNGHPAGSPELRTSGDTPDVISGLAMAAAAAATNPRPKKNHYKRKEQRPAPQPDPSTFELSEDTKVATVIARLATRLRKRISTIRWSGHENRPEVPRQTDPPHDQIDSGEGDAVGDDLEPRPYTRVVRKKSIDVPPQLHRPPRGFSPASPFVPSNVKNTWGRAKTSLPPKRT